MMYPHGDPVISGVDPKVVPDKPSDYHGPRCGYTVREKVGGVETAKQCNSPEVTWNVTGHRGFVEKKTPVCEKHIGDAWRSWNVDSAEPIKK